MLHRHVDVDESNRQKGEDSCGCLMRAAGILMHEEMERNTESGKFWWRLLEDLGIYLG